MAPTKIIGREAEIELLHEILVAPKAHLVAVYGRRRVGKTYLIRTCLKDFISFEFSGIHNVTTETQLGNFTKAIAAQLNNKVKPETPGNWFDAFNLLFSLLQKKTEAKKMCPFFR